MKPPPVITTDDHGRINNLTEITRWAYLNDPTYRQTDALSDLMKESYTARLERMVAVQTLEKHMLLQELLAQAPPARQITVTTPQDDHDIEPDETSVLLTLLIALTAAASLAVAAYGYMTDRHPVAIGGLSLAVIGLSFIVRKGVAR